MPQVIASVKALIKNQDRFLFIKERLHKGEVWDLPGGKIEYGESPLAALKREVKEELSIDIKIGRPIGTWWFISQNNQHQVICSTYLCQWQDKYAIDLTHNPADENITEYFWLTRSEILNITDMIEPSLKELIKKIK
jgi:8-oxo-dGTP pyrophosphatase MutT (NUDIX family)